MSFPRFLTARPFRLRTIGVVAGGALMLADPAYSQSNAGSPTSSTSDASSPASARTPNGRPSNADFSSNGDDRVPREQRRRNRSDDGGLPPLRPQRIYFPPNPPPLGVQILPGSQDRRLGGPRSLAPYVYELFYAPLSTKIAEGTISSRHQQFLEQHRAAKANLLEELREKIAAVQRLDPAARLAELEAFAKVQTPRIAELEKRADDFRADLFRGGFFSEGTGDWYALRDWKLGRSTLKGPREENRYLEYQLMRAAAFYQDGLLPAQRRLLRELSMELEEELFRRSQDLPSASEWFLFFSPEMSRIHLPDDLSSGVVLQIEEYREAKARLKEELQDAVYEYDKVWFSSTRNKAMEDLAERQNPRIAALEILAENIRRELARSPRIKSQQPDPPLPPELVEAIADYDQNKRVLQRELATRISAATRAVPIPLEGATVEEIREWNQDRAAVVSDETAKFEKENNARIQALEAKLEEIRAQVEHVAGPEAAFGSGPAFDSFLREFLSERRQKSSYYEYHIAVLEPGLSPEQRRLLFDAAIVALDLPLPGPEVQPTSVPGTILRN